MTFVVVAEPEKNADGRQEYIAKVYRCSSCRKRLLLLYKVNLRTVDGNRDNGSIAESQNPNSFCALSSSWNAYGDDERVALVIIHYHVRTVGLLQLRGMSFSRL